MGSINSYDAEIEKQLGELERNMQCMAAVTVKAINYALEGDSAQAVNLLLGIDLQNAEMQKVDGERSLLRQRAEKAEAALAEERAKLTALRARLAYVEACWANGDEVWGQCEECGRPISSEEPTSHPGPPDGDERNCQDCSAKDPMVAEMLGERYDPTALARDAEPG